MSGAAPVTAADAHEPVRDSRALTRTAQISVVAAATLVALKLVVGLLSGSLGLLAEAAHSGTDLVAALLTFLALRVAVRPADRDHPYGHGKAEHLAALAEGTFLVLVAAAIAVQAVRRLVGDGHGAVEAHWWTLAVLVLVLVIDASRATISHRTARRHNSAALAANALHFASDFVGTLAVLAGLLLARAGWPEADAIAALIVAGLVVLAAVRLMRRNVRVLMDQAPGSADATARAAIAAAELGVELRRLRLRQSAGRYFVDAVIGVRPDATLGQSHVLADSVEDAVRRALPGSDVVVHVEPGEQDGDLRERASAAALSVLGVHEVHNVRVLDVEGRPELSLHLKLPSDLDLAAAHEITSEVERTIREAVGELRDVHTHIEPLTPESAGSRPASASVEREAEAVRQAVREVFGEEPLRLSFRSDDRGLVALLTVRVSGGQRLDEAHAAASELERRILLAAPAIADVIVHTEPG